MEGLPVTIRLLDPPLHEFLPNLEDLLTEVTRLRMDPEADPRKLKEKETLLAKVKALHEFNPMMGHRGCRLGLSHPEIYEMQAEAIFRAAAELIEEGSPVRPEVMIPRRPCQRVEGASPVGGGERPRRGWMEETGSLKSPIPFGTMNRSAPGRPHGGCHRRGSRLFLLWNQRPDPDDLRLLSRDDAEGKFLRTLHRAQAFCRTIPCMTLDAWKAWANWCGWAWNWAGKSSRN